MEPEFLMHFYWRVGEELCKADPLLWWVLATIPITIILGAACDLWESKGKQLLRLKRKPPP